jgi:uncharacterized protein YbbC (DUF1343 family)
MIKSGLECFLENFPYEIKDGCLGVVCHAASITSSYEHIIDVLARHKNCRLGAIFGPQHGLYGQTQDNMIEWEGIGHDLHKVPVYSLYGKVRKPTPEMLKGLDAMVFDLQDVGARPYTYLWTLKLCMEACREQGMPLYVLDRPNPVGCMAFDGPVLKPDYFSFVGGAEIPLCHRLTIGEIAALLRQAYYPAADVRIVWMQGWWRNSVWSETGLPWVLPSPNMPTPDTALVYPGMVLLEATTLSEGRGTTRPFEIFGAPFLNIKKFRELLEKNKLPKGCVFREHEFIPTFQKWAGNYCYGMQIHVTDPRVFRPVETAAAVLLAANAVAPGEFLFRTDPYEYEREKMAIDILTGSDRFRKAVLAGAVLSDLRREWQGEHEKFIETFRAIAHYPEERP